MADDTWTKEQEQVLLNGVATFGEGRWEKILLWDGKTTRALIEKKLPEVKAKYEQLKVGLKGKKPVFHPLPALQKQIQNSEVNKTVLPPGGAVRAVTITKTSEPAKAASTTTVTRTIENHGPSRRVVTETVTVTRSAPTRTVTMISSVSASKPVVKKTILSSTAPVTKTTVTKTDEKPKVTETKTTTKTTSTAAITKQIPPAQPAPAAAPAPAPAKPDTPPLKNIKSLHNVTGGKLFEDPDFLCQPSSMFRDDLSRIDPRIKWLRPSEYASDPVLFQDGVEAGDVCQGDLGDCWFLSAASCVGASAGLIPKLFATATDPGRYEVRFFKNGLWRPVFIDDRIPCVPDPDDGGYRPVFGRSKNKNECWVPLIEKAYAKIHGCYEYLEGGTVAQGLADMTGGTSEFIDFDNPEVVADVKSGRLWHRFMELATGEHLLGCGYGDPAGPVEGAKPDGILCNHAYAVIDCKESNGFQLMKCRNPWGKQGEWNGKWSDSSDLWQKHPKVAQELNFAPGNDGVFWIDFMDFLVAFNEAYACHMFNDKNQKQIVFGDMFYEDTDGGCPLWGKYYNPNWRCNPQFILSTHADKPTTLFIHMSQPDSRMDYGKPDYPLSIGFIIVHPKKREGIADFKAYPRFLELPTKENIVGKCIHEPSRFVSDELILPPNNGSPFAIIPYMMKMDVPHAVGNDGRFLFDVFSNDKTFDFTEVDQSKDFFIYEIKSEFNSSNAGGQWKHPSWNTNPQISFATTENNATISIVLHGAKELQHLGLTVFRDDKGSGHIPECDKELMVGMSQFLPEESPIYDIANLPKYNYVAVPCTYNPGLTGKFKVLLFSSCALEFGSNSFETRTLEAGRITDKLPRNVRHFAMPMGYDNTPPKTILEDKLRAHFVVSTDADGQMFLDDEK